MPKQKIRHLKPVGTNLLIEIEQIELVRFFEESKDVEVFMKSGSRIKFSGEEAEAVWYAAQLTTPVLVEEMRGNKFPYKWMEED